MNDIRVRRALAHALDLEEFAHLQDTVPARGGVVHPHVPGHSPGLDLGFDPDAARHLLAEAGFPDANGMPLLRFEHPGFEETVIQSLVQQWWETLNLRVEVIYNKPGEPTHRASSHLFIHGWMGDYPDPDTFLRESLPYHRWLTPNAVGARYMQLIEDAVHVLGRAQRMAMYREADRILVAERVLVIPLDYGSKDWDHITRPWVTVPTPNSMMPFKKVTIQPH
jgi:oligopeptide transport system substrate-binding protein